MTANNERLQFGCYYATRRYENGLTEQVLLKPLTQTDYVDGWQCKLPKNVKKNNIYNWNVQLSQLPPHLWNKAKLRMNEDGKYVYNKIRNGIYHYNVSKTDFDNEMRSLYEQVNSSRPNLQYVRELVEVLKREKLTGWLLTRGMRLLA